MGPTIILCIKVFFFRICDVSIGTIRTIQIVKGNRKLAAVFGFVEVFLWFMIVREALTSDMGGAAIAACYAAGYATGTFIGCFISERFVSRKLCVQIVTSHRDAAAIHTIREEGFAVSVVEVLPSEFAEGKYMLMMEIDSRRHKTLMNLINELDPHAFVTVSESKTVYNGYFAK